MKSFIAATAVLALLVTPALAGNGGASISSSASLAISKSHSSSYSQGGAGGAGGQGGAGGNAVNAGNNQSTSFKDRVQIPGASGGGLTSSGNCPIGSFYIGVPYVSLGLTNGDGPCRDVYLIQQGWGRQARSDRSAAIVQRYLLQNNAKIRMAVTGK